MPTNPFEYIARLFRVPVNLIDPEQPMTSEPADPYPALDQPDQPETSTRTHRWDPIRTKVGRVLQEEVDRRLAESRCVWCGQPIPATAAADDMFDSEGCTTAWRASTAKVNSGGTDVFRQADWPGERLLGETPPSWLGPQPYLHYDPVREPVASVITEPGQPVALEPPPGSPNPPLTADTRSLAYANNSGHRIIDRTPLPAALDYTPPPGVDIGELRNFDSLSSEHISYGVTTVDRGPNPPIVVGQDTARRTSATNTAISDRPFIADFVLRRTEPPAQEAGRWPLRSMSAAERQGYKLFMPTGAGSQARSEFYTRWWPAADNSADRDASGPLQPQRHCPRCGRAATPTPVTAVFPAATDLSTYSQRFGYEVTPQRQTKLCCGACYMPYPGPVIVPMVKAPSDTGLTPFAWSYLLVSQQNDQVYTYAQIVTVETHEGRARGLDLRERVWGYMHRGLAERANPWPCCLPGCQEKAREWVLLAGSLTWQGWTWAPHDGAPLHMGLCPHHYYTLHTDVATSLNEHWPAYPLDLGSGVHL